MMYSCFHHLVISVCWSRRM